MTEQEKQNLLEKARNDFPIGTKFYPVTNTDGTLSNIKYEQSRECYIYSNRDEDFSIIGSANIYLHRFGTWAKIIELPQGYIPKDLLTRIEIY